MLAFLLQKKKNNKKKQTQTDYMPCWLVNKFKVLKSTP